MSNKIWLAPAKVNHFLHITGQRQDGYHELQTVFQFLNYSDELYFHVLKHNEILHNNPIVGLQPEDDLVVRAARLLQQYTQCSLGAQINITKRLPMGGGLGGGSSDAATTLVALNTLWKLNLDNDTLAQLGVQLGADVPIFVHGVAAWAEGVGDQLTAIELDEPWFIIVIPSINISTAEVFSNPDLQRNCLPITMDDFFMGKGSNVCESIVSQLYPEVAETMQWLNQFSPARMTGTGSCVFATLPTKRKAEQILLKLPKKLTGFIAQGKNISPLYSNG
ncbi:MAG: 4-(cytidine 5'-diphospho)-2-C-methyl-D-erythritol kinase [Gammaproteobacteria bacterium]|nr:4-(cytidine 5'-diphospho)-2-C-methyl-D-erythritol kinase [Gammaproteobacteria bacterium]